MFERGQRQRQADRARIASLGGYVGRNLGDQPYIMDMVLHEHFASPQAVGGTLLGTPFFYTTMNSGDITVAVPTSVVLRTGTSTNSDATMITSATAGMTGYTRDASMRARWKVTAIDATTTLLVGFRSSGSLLSAADGMFIGAMGAVSTTHFVCITRSGGLATVSALDGAGGRAVAALDTSYHDTSIVCDSTAGEVRFYFDRQLAAAITADIPTGTLIIAAGAENGLTGGTLRTLSIDVIMAAEAAP